MAKKAVASPDDIVARKQSVELVRIVITLTISQILWGRRVFSNWENWYIFNPDDARTSYDSFMMGNSNESNQNLQHAMSRWPIVSRSQGPGVNKLLNLLENGVKNALESDSLSKLQISFHSIDGKPPSQDNLMESYALAFVYRDDNHHTLELTAETRHDVTASREYRISDVKKQSDALLLQLSHLVVHSYSTSPLKTIGEYRMFLRMVYVGSNDYIPVGFHEDEAWFSLLENHCLDERMKVMTGHHSVIAGADLRTATARSQPVASPRTNTLLQSVTNTALNALQSDRESSSPVAEESTTLYDSTQPENVKKINTMGASRQANSKAPSTQVNSSSPVREHTPVRDSFEETLASHYSQAVLDRVKRLHNGSETQRVDTCECGGPLSDAESRPINRIDCTLCGGPRHVSCYGYFGDSYPDSLVCYSCLEVHFPEAKADLKKVKALCIKRRVLIYFIMKQSLIAIKDLATYLNCTSKKARNTLDELNRENLLLGNKSRKSKSDNPLYTFVGSELAVREQYFNPNTGLEHFLARPQSQADIPATIQSGGQSAVQSVTQSTALSSSQSSAGHSAKRPRPNAQTPRMSKRVKTSITTSPWIFRK